MDCPGGRRTLEEVGERAEHFALFPLGLVAVPGELLPLHVFEDRYRVMFDRLLAEDAEFGVVWASDDGLRSVGCACEVERVLQRHEDGRLDVLTRGTCPIRIVGNIADAPYPHAAVEFCGDDEPGPDVAVLAAAHEAYGRLVEEITDDAPDPVRLAVMDAYAMAATVDLGLRAKQALLEMRSETARLRLLTRLLRDGLAQLGEEELRRARAASNGRIRLG